MNQQIIASIMSMFENITTVYVELQQSRSTLGTRADRRAKASEEGGSAKARKAATSRAARRRRRAMVRRTAREIRRTSLLSDPASITDAISFRSARIRGAGKREPLVSRVHARRRSPVKEKRQGFGGRGCSRWRVDCAGAGASLTAGAAAGGAWESFISTSSGIVASPTRSRGEIQDAGGVLLNKL